MLCDYYRAVPEPECHRTISADRGGVDYGKPQLFVKLGDSELSVPYVFYETLDDLCLPERLSFDGFQFIHLF
ncbi:MAG: nusB [Bacillota bacterium]|nr:MAG: nusB [Bacillota bacterium]